MQQIQKTCVQCNESGGSSAKLLTFCVIAVWKSGETKSGQVPLLTVTKVPGMPI
jgi:hypothetical protein